MKIVQSEIKELAEVVAKLTRIWLRDRLDQPTVISAAKDAADAFAAALDLDLKEHGVEVEYDLEVKV